MRELHKFSKLKDCYQQKLTKKTKKSNFMIEENTKLYEVGELLCHSILLEYGKPIR